MNLLSILYLFLVISSYAHATPKKLMVCLGKEEQFLHETKVLGPYFKLNQQLISLFIQSPDNLELKDENYSMVCGTDIKFPSIKLLELLILNGTELFSINLNQNDITNIAMTNIAIDEIKEKSADILINFLANLQADASTVNCLESQIPELKMFFEQLLYIQEEYGKKNIINDLKKKSKAFGQLEKTADLLKNCKAKQQLKQ